MAAWTESHFLQALGWATLNSFWQMALLWFVFASVNHTFKLSAARKYQAAVGAILLGFFWFVSTLVFYYVNHSTTYAFFQNTLVHSNYLLHICLLSASVTYLLLLVFPAVRLFRNWQFVQQIKKEKLLYDTVETASYTRENLIVYEEATRQQFRFGMPGSPVTEKELKAILDKVEQAPCDYIVASGSLLPGIPMDILGQVAQIAKQKGAKLLMDTSGEALKKALEVGVYLLKPNLGELSSLVGKEEVTHESVDQIAKEIIAGGQCEVMVVSLGAKGARMITKDEVYAVASPVVKSVSTLGAGDSMVAGMVLKLSQNRPLKEVLQFGVACGTAATLTEGSDLVRKADVDRLFNIISTS